MQYLAMFAYDWAIRCFGQHHVHNRQVRTLRLLEEATELAQASGVKEETAAELVSFVYGRPAGEFHQEVGGVALTLVVLCQANGRNVERVLGDELRRVLNKSPKEFAARNDAKVRAGFGANEEIPF